MQKSERCAASGSMLPVKTRREIKRKIRKRERDTLRRASMEAEEVRRLQMTVANPHATQNQTGAEYLKK